MKHMTITVTAADGVFERTVSLPDDATWPAMAYPFWQMLRALGYYVEPEEVGADVETYIKDMEEFENRGL